MMYLYQICWRRNCFSINIISILIIRKTHSEQIIKGTPENWNGTINSEFLETEIRREVFRKITKSKFSWEIIDHEIQLITKIYYGSLIIVWSSMDDQMHSISSVICIHHWGCNKWMRCVTTIKLDTDLYKFK